MSSHATSAAPDESAPRHPIPDLTYPGADDARRWLGSGAWLPLTIGAVVERAAAERGSALAVVDDRVRLTYEDLERRSAAAAGRLRECGLEPGDRVLVQLGISADAVVALLGIFRAGIVPLCAVPRYREYEMSALADRSEARAYLVEGAPDLVALAQGIAASRPQIESVIVTGGAAPEGTIELDGADPISAAELAATAPSPTDVAAFQLSGGTTGVPKIIPRFHGEYLGYAASWADRLEISERDVLLWTLPVTHNAGMICFLLPSLVRGATLAVLPRFEVETFLEAVVRERVTVTGSIGPIAPRLLDFDRVGEFDLSSVRLFVTLNRAAEIESHLGVTAMNIYGITEGMLLGSRPGDAARARHETVGHPASPHDEAVVLAPDGEQPVAAGEPGELAFRGPSTLNGYYRDAEATASAFAASGHFRTGDLVRAHRIGATTCYSFEGRLKDNIDRGGEKFGTEEIEALIGEHPAIQAACVVGMPDRYLGERVCAFVILRPGAGVPDVAPLGAFLLDRGLAKFKLPERIEQIDELPVTAVGKLDRPALRRRIAELLAGEEGRG